MTDDIVTKAANRPPGICNHGEMRRKCPYCYEDEEIESLRRERERLRRALRNIRGHVELIGGSLAKMGAVWHMADEALNGETE